MPKGNSLWARPTSSKLVRRRGEYMVLITTVKPPVGADEYTPPPTEKEIVPGEWRNGSQRFTVPEDGKSDANFDMTSR